jgi:hypothetical protein
MHMHTDVHTYICFTTAYKRAYIHMYIHTHTGSCDEDELSLPDGGCWRLAASVDDDLDDESSSESETETQAQAKQHHDIFSVTAATPSSANSNTTRETSGTWFFSGRDQATPKGTHGADTHTNNSNTAPNNNITPTTNTSKGRGLRRWFSGSHDDNMSLPESENPQTAEQRGRASSSSSSSSSNSAEFVRLGDESHDEWTPQESLDDSSMASTQEHRISQGWLAVGTALQSSSVSDSEI